VTDIDFGRGKPPMGALRLAAPRLLVCAEAVLTAESLDSLQYGDPRGYLPLREIIAAQHGVPVECVFVGNGGTLENFGFIAATSPPGTWVVETPTYDRLFETLKRHKIPVHGIPQGDLFGAQLAEYIASQQAAGQRVSVIYLIPDFHNPTGATLATSVRLQVLELAKRHGITVIEDAPYRQLRLRGTPPPSMLQLSDGFDGFMYLNSASKIISPALRVGWVIAAPRIVQALAAEAGPTYLSASMLNQAYVAEFLAQHMLEPHIDDLLKIYGPQHDAAVAGFREHLPGARVRPADGGYFLSAVLPPGLRRKNLVQRAAANGLIITPGSVFSSDPTNADENARVRVPFASLSVEEIDGGLRRLAEACSMAGVV
jgi:2-aminoadipate transaminase